MKASPINTRRLTIAPPGHFSGYFEDMCGLYRDADFHRYMSTPNSPLPEAEHVERCIRDIIGSWEEDGEGLMFMRDDARDRYVGLIGLQESPYETPEIVCGIHPQYRRESYAREAVRAVLAREFELGTQRILARAEVGNVSSHNLVAAFGFTLIGQRVDDKWKLVEDVFELRREFFKDGRDQSLLATDPRV